MCLEAGIILSLPHHKTFDKSMKYSDETKLEFAKPSDSVPLKLSKKDACPNLGKWLNRDIWFSRCTQHSTQRIVIIILNLMHTEIRIYQIIL